MVVRLGTPTTYLPADIEFYKQICGYFVSHGNDLSIKLPMIS